MQLKDNAKRRLRISPNATAEHQSGECKSDLGAVATTETGVPSPSAAPRNRVAIGRRIIKLELLSPTACTQIINSFALAEVCHAYVHHLRSLGRPLSLQSVFQVDGQCASAIQGFQACFFTVLGASGYTVRSVVCEMEPATCHTPLRFADWTPGDFITGFHTFAYELWKSDHHCRGDIGEVVHGGPNWPVQPKTRALALATRTLNGKGHPRVTLSLRSEHF